MRGREADISLILNTERDLPGIRDGQYWTAVRVEERGMTHLGQLIAQQALADRENAEKWNIINA